MVPVKMISQPIERGKRRGARGPATAVRGGHHAPLWRYLQRNRRSALAHEIDVVKQMGYASYFLTCG